MRNDFGTRPYAPRFPYSSGMKKGGKAKKQGYKARKSGKINK